MLCAVRAVAVAIASSGRVLTALHCSRKRSRRPRRTLRAPRSSAVFGGRKGGASQLPARSGKTVPLAAIACHPRSYGFPKSVLVRASMTILAGRCRRRSSWTARRPAESRSGCRCRRDSAGRGLGRMAKHHEIEQRKRAARPCPPATMSAGRKLETTGTPVSAASIAISPICQVQASFLPACRAGVGW